MGARHVLRFADRRAHGGREELSAAENVETDAISREKRAPLSKRQQLFLGEHHERVDLVRGALEVLDGERVHAHAAHVQPHTNLKSLSGLSLNVENVCKRICTHPLERDEAVAVPGEGGQAVLARPGDCRPLRRRHDPGQDLQQAQRAQHA
jgi:hypothetical protein